MNPIFEVIKLSHCSLHHIVILILRMRLYVLNDRTCLLVIFTKTDLNCLVEDSTYLILVILDVSSSSLHLLQNPHYPVEQSYIYSRLWDHLTFLSKMIWLFHSKFFFALCLFEIYLNPPSSSRCLEKAELALCNLNSISLEMSLSYEPFTKNVSKMHKWSSSCLWSWP